MVFLLYSIELESGALLKPLLFILKPFYLIGRYLSNGEMRGTMDLTGSVCRKGRSGPA